VPRSLFEDISLPHADGNFFLRPDQILAIFVVDMNKPISRTEWYFNDLELEKELDREQERELVESEQFFKSNAEFVEKGVKLVLPTVEAPVIEGEGDDENGDARASSVFSAFYRSSVHGIRASFSGNVSSPTNVQSKTEKEVKSNVNSNPFLQYLYDKKGEEEDKEISFAPSSSTLNTLSSWDKTQGMKAKDAGTTSSMSETRLGARLSSAGSIINQVQAKPTRDSDPFAVDFTPDL
jgi:hypothetical protein